MTQEEFISDFKKALIAYTLAIAFCIAAASHFVIFYLGITPSLFRMLIFLFFGLGFLAMAIETLKEIQSCQAESKPEGLQ